MLIEIRDFLEEYGTEILNFIYAYLISLFPIIGKIFAIGYSRRILKEKRFIFELFNPLKEGILRYILLSMFWWPIFLLWFFFLSVSYSNIDPVLLRKYPDIFLYPTIHKIIILLFIRRLILSFLTLAIIVYPLKKIFSMNIADILINLKILLFIFLLAGLFTYVDFKVGIFPIRYVPLNEYPFIFIFLRLFGDEVWKVIEK